MNINILRFDTIDSTNSEAIRQAKLGADEGVCIVAREQTAGRGRRERTWISNRDAGLYFSVLLRPKIDERFFPLITLMAGIAAHDTIADFGLSPDIKWVNDILIEDKKICGILAETTDTLMGVTVIVGIGVNLIPLDCGEEIANMATSISELVKDRSIMRGDVESKLVKHLSSWYATFCGKNGNDRILAEWEHRSTYFSGKHVRVMLENEMFEGSTDGLEGSGALRIKTDGGSVRIVHAGDVERLRNVE
jgi:BirA family biotin operon repressor/biotin-[acetyl-CoA-carboxylase] ligase